MVTVNRSSVGRRLAACLVGGILAASACSDTAGISTSKVQVRLTDAPSNMFASAEVWISHVYLQGRAGEPEEDGGGRVDLFNDPESPHHYDLLELQDGLAADLTGFVEIEATLTVDFDVDRNFVIQGGEGESAIRGVLFTPVLLELDRGGS